MTNMSVKSGHLFFQNLFKGVCHAKLSVHDYRMAVPLAEPDGFHDCFMSAGCNGAEVVFVKIDILGRHTVGKIPVAGFRPCPDHRIRPLSEEHQDTDADP